MRLLVLIRILLRSRVVVGSASFDSSKDDDSDNDFDNDDKKTSVNSFSEADEVDGSLAHSEDLNKLMRSVLHNNNDLVEEGELLSQALASGINNFTPDLMFEQFVNNYRTAKKIFGERLIRLTTGYSPDYIERNIRIPEFKQELKNNLEQSIKALKDRGLLSDDGDFTKQGLTLATISLVSDELDRMKQRGLLGERDYRSKSNDGLVSDERPFRKGDGYRSVNIKSSVKKSLRRAHKRILVDDLMVDERESKQRAVIMLAIDASGSMRGEKFSAAKRAAIALAYKAISKNDEVGVLLFEKKVVSETPPSNDFNRIVSKVLLGRAGKETDLSVAIRKSVELMSNKKARKHLIIITDALQTIGKNPEKKVLEAVGVALKDDVSISVIGLGLNPDGERLSKLIVEHGRGSLYLVKAYDDLDVLVIEDYYKVKS